jgi:hypothetical protein
VYLIYIYNPRKTRWLCGEFPGVAGGLPAGALAGLSEMGFYSFIDTYN